jgi:para-nitrobenzyl esterase
LHLRQRVVYFACEKFELLVFFITISFTRIYTKGFIKTHMTQLSTPALGIEYAKSVAKEKRWQHSNMQTKFSRANNKLGPIAPQVPSLNPLIQSKNVNLQQREDCLNLNIYAPQNADSLPVMVWIHGGGFQIGAGAFPEYNGENLSQAGNVVVVSINYRLACLGFLRLCDISDGTIKATGNEGLSDQITALEWIQENIHLFGGDKNNITLFGESAGAMSIACLLASPKAKTLFHKAILQSGAGHTYSSIEKANLVAAEFVQCAERLGYSLANFETLSIEELIKIQAVFLAQAQTYEKFGVLPFTPVIDGELLPEPPHQAIAKGCATDKIIMAGTNTNEWAFFAAILGQKITSEAELERSLTPMFTTQKIDDYIDWAHQQIAKRGATVSYQQVLNEIFTAYWFCEPCHRLLEAQKNMGGTAYRYQLGRRSPIEKFACTHVADIGFVFDTTNKHFHGDAPRVKALVKEIQTYWCHFAYHGMPAPTTREWPTYGNEFTFQFFDHIKTHVITHDVATANIWSMVSNQQLAAF